MDPFRYGALSHRYYSDQIWFNNVILFNLVQPRPSLMAIMIIAACLNSFQFVLNFAFK